MRFFQIFGFHISFLGLMTAIGLVVGFYIAKKEIKRKSLSVDALYSLAIYTVLFALIGARIFYVLFYNFEYYQVHPSDIIKIYDGGMSIHGGLLAAFLAAFIYIRSHRLNFLKYADAIAPSIILGQGIGRIGCDVFGKPMTSPTLWGVMYQGQIVHPVQMYEAILNYLVFFFLWRIRKKTSYHGQLFFFYVILFSINRGLVEFFRFNPVIIGWFSISHLLSVSFILIAILGAYHAKKAMPTQTKTTFESSASDTHAPGLIKDILYFLGMVAVSLVIFYTVQT